MPIPGLFVEYLVTGSMALLWVLPLVERSASDCLTGSPALVAAFAPALYVLGMAMDALGFWITARLPTRAWSLKTQARRFADRSIGGDPGAGPAHEGIHFASARGRGHNGRIWLHLNAPELLKEVEMRSSRDRIARGAIANMLLIAGTALLPAGSSLFAPQHPFLVWPLLVVGAVLVWAYLEGESYRFEIRCETAARAKLTPPSPPSGTAVPTAHR